MRVTESRLIILRGNSGSGKTTIAKALQAYFGHGILVVSQDVVRRDMLKVRDTDNNLAIELIRQIAAYGYGKVPYVIVEGILASARYKAMLLELIVLFGKCKAYYFDLSFEETLRRHETKENCQDFGAIDMRKWWLDKDYLGVPDEKIFYDEDSKADVMAAILKDIEEN